MMNLVKDIDFKILPNHRDDRNKPIVFFVYDAACLARHYTDPELSELKELNNELNRASDRITVTPGSLVAAGDNMNGILPFVRAMVGACDAVLVFNHELKVPRSVQQIVDIATELEVPVYYRYTATTWEIPTLGDMFNTISDLIKEHGRDAGVFIETSGGIALVPKLDEVRFDNADVFGSLVRPDRVAIRTK